MTKQLMQALVAVGTLTLATSALAGAPPELKGKLDAKLAALKWMGSDAQVVAAVKAYNASPPAATAGMTQDKWKGLSLLDPVVKELAKNALATYLKGKKDAAVTELFVNGADGGKVALLAKTSAWSHKGKPKHDDPMAGKDWVGGVEMDESTGVESVQVAFPVLDGGKAVGSVVVGLAVAKLK